MFRCSVKSTGYPLHSPVSPLHFHSRASPCAITFQLDSTNSAFARRHSRKRLRKTTGQPTAECIFVIRTSRNRCKSSPRSTAMFSVLQLTKKTRRWKEEPDVGTGKVFKPVQRSATEWTLERSWLYFRHNQKVFLFSWMSRTALGPRRYRGLFPWVQSGPLTPRRTYFNPLTPNAPLNSKRCILYIYSSNIGTEYFKHGIYSPFFFLQNAVCFIILTY